jgi:hypothetical protein
MDRPAAYAFSYNHWSSESQVDGGEIKVQVLTQKITVDPPPFKSARQRAYRIQSTQKHNKPFDYPSKAFLIFYPVEFLAKNRRDPASDEHGITSGLSQASSMTESMEYQDRRCVEDDGLWRRKQQGGEISMWYHLTRQ